MVHGSTMECLMDLMQRMWDTEVRIDRCKNETSVIHFGRNRIVKSVLAPEVPHPDFLWWIDMDLEFDPDSLLRLFSHQKMFICGNYARRYPPHLPTVGRVNKEVGLYETISKAELEKGGLIPVDSATGGFTLVHSSIYKKVSYPWYEFGFVEGVDIKHPWELIDIGEDVYFSQKARQAGFDIWCDLDIPLAHFTTSKLTKKEMLEAYDDETVVQ